MIFSEGWCVILKITALLDNKPSEHKELISEHGLSLYVEYKDKKILFDFGAGDVILFNSDRLDIDLAEADYMVCSHAHYDHATGFKDLLYAGIKPEALITGKGFWNDKYAFDGVKYTYLGTGFTAKTLEEFGVKHEVCEEGIKELFEGCYVVTDFERTHDFETIPGRFVIRHEDGSFIKDDFSDEVCLVFDTEKGLVVLVGCSHPGILNMLKTIQKRLNKKIYTFIGGSHLVEADEERLKTTISEMKEMGIELTAFSHCSGSRVNEMLAENKEIESTHLATGDVMYI